MTARTSRRRFLQRGALGALRLGIVLGGVEAGRQALDLVEQRRAWAEASRPNGEFIARHQDKLASLRLGASFAPEQWPADRPHEALAGLRLTVDGLGLRDLRLGVRWSRAAEADGRVSLGAYAPYVDTALTAGAAVCLNVGPVRTFRWPEEHVPPGVLEATQPLPPAGGRLEPAAPLAVAALVFLDGLLAALRAAYGPAFAALQAENEPFYPLGVHRWLMSPAYVETVIERIVAAFPAAALLVTSAGRLNLLDVRDLFVRLLARDGRFAGRLVAGFDFHYKTPLRDSVPVVRHFDQISYAQPFAPTLAEQRRHARGLGYRLEVTEGQMEPYGHLTSPGNSARDFRYMLLRCLDEVLDRRAPALIRLWGVEELTKRMLAGRLTNEHRQIIELIEAINSGAADGRRA